MNKLRFANGNEIEIVSVAQNDNTLLNIEMETSNVNDVISAFNENADQTSVMRYYVGTDLIRGYAGFTNMTKVEYIPRVVKSIDYSETDPTTASGFVEEVVDKAFVTMSKPDAVTALQADVATINQIMEG